jgi:hypothetical protein
LARYSYRRITREEVIAICEGLLAHLREAARQWEKTGLRNDQLTNEAVEQTRQRVNELEEFLAKDPTRGDGNAQ